jgi:hypothetical protein
MAVFPIKFMITVTNRMYRFHAIRAAIIRATLIKNLIVGP